MRDLIGCYGDVPGSGNRDPLRVLVILKSWPARNSSNKSEAIWSVLDILVKCGFSVSVMAWGRHDRHRPQTMEFQIAPNWFRFVVRKFLALLRKAGLRPLAEALEFRFFGLMVSHKRKMLEKFDVCLALNHSSSPSLIALQIHEKLAIPFVVREHQIVENRSKSSGDFLLHHLRALRRCSELVAVSPFLANQLEQLGVRTPISVIPNSISDDWFASPQESPALDHNLLAWGRGRFIFGAWTRWRSIKRLDLLLDSFLKVSKELPDVKLVIAGKIEGREQRKLVKSFMSKPGMEQSLLVYGQADRVEIQSLAHWVDAVVLSSDYETFGLPALEGLLAGKPVVTTMSNGPEYLVSEPYLGETSIRGSAEQLAHAMIRVYRSRNRYSAEKIQSYVKANFSQSASSSLWVSAISRAALVPVSEQ